MSGRGDTPRLGGWFGRLKYEFENKGRYNEAYNLGIPGETLQGILDRFDKEADARIKPRENMKDEYKIIFEVGTNDAKGKGTPNNYVPKEVFGEKLEQLIDKALERVSSDEIAIIGMSPVDETKTTPYEGTYMYNSRHQEFNTMMKRISEQKNILFIDIFKKLNTLEYLETLEDGLHPDGKGYDLKYDLIKKQLNKNKFSKSKYKSGIVL